MTEVQAVPQLRKSPFREERLLKLRYERLDEPVRRISVERLVWISQVVDHIHLVERRITSKREGGGVGHLPTSGTAEGPEDPQIRRRRSVRLVELANVEFRGASVQGDG